MFGGSRSAPFSFDFAGGTIFSSTRDNNKKNKVPPKLNYYMTEYQSIYCTVYRNNSCMDLINNFRQVESSCTSESEVAFDCSRGVPSAVLEVLFPKGAENLASMLLPLTVQFPSPRLKNGNTFGAICTGKETPIKKPIAAADNTLRIGFDFILTIH
jgi:hypothetical protein